MHYVYHYYLQVILMIVTSEEKEHFNIKHYIYFLITIYNLCYSKIIEVLSIKIDPEYSTTY